MSYLGICKGSEMAGIPSTSDMPDVLVNKRIK